MRVNSANYSHVTLKEGHAAFLHVHQYKLHECVMSVYGMILIGKHM